MSSFAGGLGSTGIANVQFSPDGGHLDPFSRFRVSQNHILFTSQLTYSLLPLIWDTKIIGTGTVTHLPNESSALLTIGTDNGDKVIRQTKKYFLYRAGQGQLVLSSFTGGEQTENIIQRVGYFDDYDGVFLEITETDLHFVIRSSTSGSVVENKIAQNEWNLDKLDGTGNSGVLLDITRANIFVMDLQWLGVGNVRVGFDMNKTILYTHIFEHANINTKVYMRTASLPCRYEIENIGASVGGNLKQIGTAVIREGGDEETGILTSADTGFNVVSANSTNPTSALSVTLDDNFIRACIQPVELVINNRGSASVRWRLILNPTLTGTLTWTHSSTSSNQSITQLVYTEGTGHVISTGYVGGTGKQRITLSTGVSKDNVLGLSSDIDGNKDIISVIVDAENATHDIDVALQFLELF